MATYREAGVDLFAADRLVDSIASGVTATWSRDVVGSFGGFAAGIRVPAGYRDPVMMLSTDGVGTKAEVARTAERWDGLGADLVAMCADDLAAAGARPVALVDYLAVGRIDPERDRRIIASVAAACEEAGIALLGGETAEHPGVMDPDRFDLAGTALGVVEADGAIDGTDVRPGDAIVALASPNVRSNGFSLLRAAVLSGLSLESPFPDTDRTVAEVLLEPSIVYSPLVTRLVETFAVHGLAHVTGGGIPGNLIRILPEGTRALVDRSSWTPPHVFAVVQQMGGIEVDEMFAVFNMGIGFTVVVAPDEADGVVATATAAGHGAWICGEIQAGGRAVILT